MAGDQERHRSDGQDTDEEPFLSRWVRRKSESRSAPAAAPGPEAAAPAAVEPAPPVLTDADMPPLDALTEGSDFSPFMSPGVSEELRRHALRRLFGAPRFNVRDGLDDYDDDYRQFGHLAREVAERIKERLGMVRPEPDDAGDAQPAIAQAAAVPEAAAPASAPADGRADADDDTGAADADDAAAPPNPKG